MQVNRYLPPNKRATIIKEKVICKDDMVLFPSLNNSKKEVQSARDDELSGWSNIVKPMDDIENDDNGNAILSSSFYDNLELEYDNYNNYINRKSAVAFEKMLTMDVVYKSQPIYSSFIYWFNDMMDNGILPEFYKSSYIFTVNIQRVKSYILHWLFTIYTMPYNAVGVEFPINMWIKENKTIRRPEDIAAYTELLNDNFWRHIFNKWGLDESIFFGDSKQAFIMQNDFPYILYSLLDLTCSKITDEITHDISLNEEHDARRIVFNSRFRNGLDDADEFNTIIKTGVQSDVNRDNLRGDRCHDIW